MSSEATETQDNVTHFYPVWISSVEHLSTFSKFIEGLSSWKILRRKYEIPPGFPYIQASWGLKTQRISYLFFMIIFTFQFINFLSTDPLVSLISGVLVILSLFLFVKGIGLPKGFPVILFSCGHLKITKGKISFFAIPYKVFGNKFFNLSTTLEFQLNPSDIEKLNRYEPSKHLENFKKRFDLKWIRIKTKEEVLGGDFLLCIGGTTGPFMKKA